jgi:hypothetical protein
MNTTATLSSSRRLWLSLLLAPMAWLADLEASYALAAQACIASPGHRLALYLVPLAAAFVAGLGAVLAWQVYTRTTTPAPAAAAAEGSERFLALASVVASVFFVLIILVQTIPNVLLGACD